MSPAPPPFAEEVAALAQRLGSDPHDGLSEAEAARRLRADGPNRLRATHGRPAWAILLAQFRSLVTLLLLFATGLAFVLGDALEAYAILAVILLNAGIGFATEWRAERALTALRNEAAPTATVVREGRPREVDAATLVVGDLVTVQAGDRVPADGRVTEAARLTVQEAALTGESTAVEKTPEAEAEAEVPLAERRGMLHLGTTVAGGRGAMLVTATGMRTEVGRIGVLLEETVQRDTPLEQRLDGLGRTLVAVVAVVAVLVVAAGVLRGHPLLPMLEVGVSLAIAAVPEGLPAVATMTLALGMQRMARANALVRRLPAVETLGSTTVICTDKTGTLTRNEMTVTRVLLDERMLTVGGDEAAPGAGDPHWREALRIGLLCNDARVVPAEGGAEVLGDPTEAALVRLAQWGGLDPEAQRRRFPRRDEVPFDSERKWMATVHEAPEGGLVVYLKGAPAAVLALCERTWTEAGDAPLDEPERARILARAETLAASGARVLALARRSLDDGEGSLPAGGTLVRGATLAGLVGMTDPLRPGVKEAVARCIQAGIRTIMVTGDAAPTAAAIARQLGLLDAGGDAARRVRHADDLEGLDAAGWRDLAADVAVYARVTPEHKLRIVEALQARGEIVAMTGDGVNDAPALRQADIGVAMGRRGTAVAREASDMILRDDDFTTIAQAVEGGRGIYANIQRFIHYLFSCNLSEILTVAAALALAWPLPLAPLQILWLNLVTDVFPALALAFEPHDRDLMAQSPRDPDAPLLDWRFGWLLTWQGTLLAAVTLGAFGIGLQRHGAGEGLDHAVTMAFMTLAFAQILHVFDVRSRRASLASWRLFRNPVLWGAVFLCVGLQWVAVSLPPLQRVLGTVMLAPRDWAVVLLAALLPVLVVEAVKAAGRLRSVRAR